MVLEFTGLFLAVLIAGMVHASVGFGFGLIAAPVLGVVQPDALPGAVLLLVLALSLGVTFRNRGAVDREALGWLLSGRLAGALVGAWMLSVAPRDSLSVLFGGVILGSVALTGLKGIPKSWATSLGAGVAAGVFGTTGGVGGPALGLAYQGRPGPELRGTLGVVMSVGTGASLVFLLAWERLEFADVTLGLMLLPGMLLGLWGSQLVAGRLDRGWVRPAVLTWATIGAVGAIVKGLVS